jgi:hypothetical protein
VKRVSPGWTKTATQLDGGAGQDGAGWGVSLGIDVFVGVGDSAAGGKVGVAVKGIGVLKDVCVGSVSAGFSISARDNDNPPRMMSTEKKASRNAPANWRKLCITSFLLAWVASPNVLRLWEVTR